MAFFLLFYIGRTGTMICTWLIDSDQFERAKVQKVVVNSLLISERVEVPQIWHFSMHTADKCFHMVVLCAGDIAFCSTYCMVSTGCRGSIYSYAYLQSIQYKLWPLGLFCPVDSERRRE